MIPSVLMTRPAGDAPAPPQAASVTLADFPHLALQQIANLPAAELARLQQEADAAMRHAKSIVALLEDALDHRYGPRAHQARAAQEKDTGTVRFEDNGFIVVADLPKRVKWDQRHLAELVEIIRSDWRENPGDYVKMKLEVSERAYDAWPPMLKDLFTPARTVETGKPSYKLEHIDGRRT